MSPALDPGLAAARDALRAQQQAARERLGVMQPIGRDDARARAAQRERDAQVVDGWVRSGPFRYAIATEQARWARTRDIIERVEPGPDEDGRQLEMVARQAASIEFLLRGELDDAAAAPAGAQLRSLCDRLLLATLPALDLSAFTRRHGDHHFVLVSAGLIDFTYQLAKAVVLSWRPQGAAGGRVGFSTGPDDVDAVLQEMPWPLLLLRSTVESYLFAGLPRMARSPAPPPVYHPPLATLTAFNERFVIAHEIAHTLHDELDIVHPGALAAHGEEHAADVWALSWTMHSADRLDGVSPNIAAQGAFFTLTVLDLLHQALDLVRHGQVREGERFVGHPPTAHRLATLREAYGAMVTRADDDLSLRASLAPAQTLTRLWQRVLETGAARAWQGRPLHPLWKDTR